ncbi:unnamed protein product, partial [Medioppia subpectinata]
MHLDVESGQQLIHSRRQSSQSVTKWKGIPRMVRLWLMIGLAVTVFLILLLSLPKEEPLVSAADDTDPVVRPPPQSQPRTDGQIADNNNNNKPNNQINRPNINHKTDDNNNNDNDYRDRAKGYTSFDQTLATIDGLSVNVFKESIERHESAEQKAIVEALRHSWDAYREYAWGADHLRPITKSKHNWFSYAWGADHLRPITKSKHNWFSVGLTILDSLDTLIMMGLKDEFNDAMNWIKNDLRFDIYKDVNCFETTIRALAGLLSGYHLSSEPTLLIRAADLGERLIHCFDTPKNLVPFSDVNLQTKSAKTPNWSPDSSLSEVSTVQLEFRDLSYLTGIKKYEKLSFRTSQHIHNLTVKSGKYLLPMYINPYTGQFSRGTITLGARGDSYYEYLLKQYIQTGIPWLKEDYIKSMDELQKRLVRT